MVVGSCLTDSEVSFCCQSILFIYLSILLSVDNILYLLSVDNILYLDFQGTQISVGFLKHSPSPIVAGLILERP